MNSDLHAFVWVGFQPDIFSRNEFPTYIPL